MKRKIISTISILICSIFLLNMIVGWTEKPVIINRADIENSVSKSFLLLQKSGYKFVERNRLKCGSCHHNTLTSMVAGMARKKGIPEVDSLTTHRVVSLENSLWAAANPNFNNEFVAANFIAPYVLLGLYAEKYPANLYTDIAVDYLVGQQQPDGKFPTEALRVPLESGEIHLAAFSIRAIQLYASPAKKKMVGELIARTKQFLEKSNPTEQQELAFQLLGMYWCGSGKELIKKVAEKLKSMQNADGGWSQLPTMQSDAYATGQTLYALFESGSMNADDPIYQKGMSYLLKTQDESGAWIVATRAFPIQPFFSSDFPPYDENQYISATATNWAAMALLEALPNHD
ncbi:MAG: terpene cyclase/mutase family protein [Bacteroidetes bacterium]|nr:terpene cyclase/mutase family protein [Bacteroidota bacterium]